MPVLVRSVDDDRELLELALVENLQRADLDPVEEAEAYRTLIESFGLSHEEVARRVGKSRTAVSNALRLLRLPPVKEPAENRSRPVDEGHAPSRTLLMANATRSHRRRCCSSCLRPAAVRR